MQVEAIYDHGRLEFVHPVQLKHDRVRLVVEVPDEEIVNLYNLPAEMLAQAQAMLDKLDAVRNAPLPPDQASDAFSHDALPELTAKQLERIEAFELRAQMREQQGRPV